MVRESPDQIETTSASVSVTRQAAWLSAACLIVAAVHVVAVRGVWSQIPLQTDAGIWAYMGWRIDHGAVVYRDLWDNKPPGIFYAFAWAQRFAPAGSDAALHVMDAVASLAVLGLTWR